MASDYLTYLLTMPKKDRKKAAIYCLVNCCCCWAKNVVHAFVMLVEKSVSVSTVLLYIFRFSLAASSALIVNWLFIPTDLIALFVTSLDCLVNTSPYGTEGTFAMLANCF